MTLQDLLDKKNLTMYQLSKLSGVPKTTVIDLFSGRSRIGACNARTLQRIANVLGCSIEDLLIFDDNI